MTTTAKKPFKNYSIIGMIILSSFGSISESVAQQDELEIRKIREASNSALRAYDNDLVLSFLTEDVLTTTGNGTLLAGKDALRNYILAAGESKMYWIRTALEVNLNEAKGLAWETGTWKGYDPEQEEEAIIGGKYSAQWTKASGTWLIKSQLFVSLE
ncbi:nuclear transport factor 2 family protein [Fulvivirga sp.]|uniref:YybH family protein n=1 Tax=Fulvivirga sp. TaxID=1931237 RepID=UPI0032EBBFBE